MPAGSVVKRRPFRFLNCMPPRFAGAAFYLVEFLLLLLAKPWLLRLLGAKPGDKKASGVATQATARIVGAIHNAVAVSGFSANFLAKP